MTVVTFLIAWMALEIRYSDLTFATLKGFFFGSKSKEYGLFNTNSFVVVSKNPGLTLKMKSP